MERSIGMNEQSERSQHARLCDRLESLERALLGKVLEATGVMNQYEAESFAGPIDERKEVLRQRKIAREWLDAVADARQILRGIAELDQRRNVQDRPIDMRTFIVTKTYRNCVVERTYRVRASNSDEAIEAASSADVEAEVVVDSGTENDPSEWEWSIA